MSHILITPDGEFLQNSYPIHSKHQKPSHSKNPPFPPFAMERVFEKKSPFFNPTLSIWCFFFFYRVRVTLQNRPLKKN